MSAIITFKVPVHSSKDQLYIIERIAYIVAGRIDGIQEKDDGSWKLDPSNNWFMHIQEINDKGKVYVVNYRYGGGYRPPELMQAYRKVIIHALGVEDFNETP